MTTLNEINIPPTEHVKVLDGQGWVGLLDHMGTETTIVNAARVSFGKMRDEMNDQDLKLLRYLLKHRHSSPFEHVTFSFSVHCPLFIRSQWHRHRTWSYNEISRRYTEINMDFYVPPQVRAQADSDRQASTEGDLNQAALQEQIKKHNEDSLKLYDQLLEDGVCREQARGVLPQNMMTTFWATADLHNLIHFLELRDSEHAQWEIRQYAQAIKELVKPHLPNLAEVLKW